MGPWLWEAPVPASNSLQENLRSTEYRLSRYESWLVRHPSCPRATPVLNSSIADCDGKGADQDHDTECRPSKDQKCAKRGEALSSPRTSPLGDTKKLRWTPEPRQHLWLPASSRLRSPDIFPTSIFKHLQASSSIFKHLQASSSIFKHLQASSSIFKHLQFTRPGLCRKCPLGTIFLNISHSSWLEGPTD